MQDLLADVEHDLQGRLRTVLHDAEEIIDAGDPKDTWADTEVWLRRQSCRRRGEPGPADRAAAQLAEDVADQFDLPEGPSSRCRGRPAPTSSRHPGSHASLATPGGKLAPMMMAARSS